MTKNIKIIRLLNGEEVLAEVVADTGLKVTIKNPIRIVVIPNKADPRQPNIGLAPWTEFSDDDTFVLDNQHILLIMNPVKEFINQYQATFSKIITPQSSILLPEKGP
jgi:hypothetical protein